MSHSTHSIPAAPLWMKRWLLAAAAYNILWGAAMVFAPIATLKALGIAPATTELWPQLWACIGMIVGVYGIGYAIAAFNPVRHWPIILVGLVGKVLGPIGFAHAASRGELPWSMGVTILSNDIIWWIPFSLTLWHAAKASQPPIPDGPVSLDTALDTLTDDHSVTLRSLSSAGSTLTVLLRHSGCTFCRQTIADLARWKPALDRAGITLAVVGMTDSMHALRDIGLRHNLVGTHWFPDPQRLLYRALDLRRGSFLQLFGPIVWIRGLLAAFQGHGIGKLEGDGFQMPGAFLIHKGRVIREYRHATAADRPNLAEFACPIN